MIKMTRLYNGLFSLAKKYSSSYLLNQKTLQNKGLKGAGKWHKTGIVEVLGGNFAGQTRKQRNLP